MHSIVDSAAIALQLILSLDASLLAIVGRSLSVSALACVIACLIGLVIGAWLGVARFNGRSAVLAFLNTFLAVIPVPSEMKNTVLWGMFVSFENA